MMFGEIWTFLRRHWVHALLCLPGVLCVTVLHEAAHALAMWAQGGTLLEFAWLPWASKGHWGYMAYEFPEAVAYSSFAIAVAPYVLWLSLAALAWALSHRKQTWSYAAGSTIFFWLYVVPLADIANAALPWLAGAENDLTQAFLAPSKWAVVLIASMAGVAIWVGQGMQQRLYAEGRLSLRAYLLLCLEVVLGLLVMTLG